MPISELNDDEKMFICNRIKELKRIVKFQEEEQIPQLKREIAILEKIISGEA